MSMVKEKKAHFKLERERWGKATWWNYFISEGKGVVSMGACGGNGKSSIESTNVCIYLSPIK